MTTGALPMLDDVAAPVRARTRSLFGASRAEIADAIATHTAHALGQIHRPWLWDDDGPVLGRAARAKLASFSLALPTITDVVTSADGSRRAVLTLDDGARIEAVWMPRAVKNPRVTLCVSSQVGCAMGCTFCATGAMGIVRNLDAGEIVGQVLALVRAFGPRTGHALNLVFMGMGEPLHNLDEVVRALAILCDEDGLGIAPRRITVSTSGVVPGIARLARAEPRPLLAVSVNATTDAARAATMPIARKYPLAMLKDALRAWPLRPNERVLLEYVLLKGVNDSEDDAARLADFARDLPHTVNLIAWNAHEGAGFERPDDDATYRFGDWLYAHGVRAFVRQSRGGDVRAACGQLVQQGRRKTRPASSRSPTA
jgi:23S rRNA (adenine2503-C2)-methyltransferase